MIEQIATLRGQPVHRHDRAVKNLSRLDHIPGAEMIPDRDEICRLAAKRHRPQSATAQLFDKVTAARAADHGQPAPAHPVARHRHSPACD